jgi:hypothetical protein
MTAAGDGAVAAATAGTRDAAAATTVPGKYWWRMSAALTPAAASFADPMTHMPTP